MPGIGIALLSALGFGVLFWVLGNRAVPRVGFAATVWMIRLTSTVVTAQPIRLPWDGKVTIWGITSTVSGNGDQGADPNKLVRVTDLLKNTDPAVAAEESFSVVRSAQNLEVLRGVAPTPAGDDDDR